jgi:hypothetical protein
MLLNLFGNRARIQDDFLGHLVGLVRLDELFGGGCGVEEICSARLLNAVRTSPSLKINLEDSIFHAEG